MPTFHVKCHVKRHDLLLRISVVVFAVILPLQSMAQPARPFLLDRPASVLSQERADHKSPHDSTIRRERRVQLNSEVFHQLVQSTAKSSVAEAISLSSLDQQTLRLQLFPDVTFEVVLSPLSHAMNRSSWSGVIAGMQDSQVVLARHEGVVAGNITTADGRLYHLRSDREGEPVVREIDPLAFPPQHPPHGAGTTLPYAEFDLYSSEPAHSNRLLSPRLWPSQEAPTTLDLMVVYTPAARVAAGGRAAMQALILLAVSETNEGYANSGVAQRLKLVHSRELNYLEDAQSPYLTALADLTYVNGVIDEVHALRTLYGADMVSLFIESKGYCGLGWQNNRPQADHQHLAFSVVRHMCAAGNFSLAHELGHNQGAAHDRDNALSFSTNHGFGYRDPDAVFRTIMAYDCERGCPRINQWSNPDVRVAGRPTGIAATAAYGADNRRLLNLTFLTVAQWRRPFFWIGRHLAD